MTKRPGLVDTIKKMLGTNTNLEEIVITMNYDIRRYCQIDPKVKI